MRRLLVVLVALSVFSVSAFSSVGIGAKFFNGSVPFLIAEIGGDNLLFELGVGFNSVAVPGFNMTMLWYSGIGRLLLFPGAFSPYVGLGGVGVTFIASYDFDDFDMSGSSSIFGVTGEGGIRFSFKEMGFPLSLFAGATVTWVPALDAVQDLLLGGVGMGWHFGAVVSF
jgi:hypothetical protein